MIIPQKGKIRGQFSILELDLPDPVIDGRWVNASFETVAERAAVDTGRKAFVVDEANGVVNSRSSFTFYWYSTVSFEGALLLSTRLDTLTEMARELCHTGFSAYNHQHARQT